MKKFFVRAFFIFSIGLLVVSLILLTATFLWENRSTIAKNLGIYLKDDCRISDFQLQCGYIDVKSTNLSLKLKDTQIELDILKILRKNEPFIFVKINTGEIHLKLDKQKRKKTRSSTNYLFFLIYFVKSDINRLNIYTQLPQGKFILKDFSFVSSYNSFHIKRPFHFVLREFSGTVKELSGVIETNNINIRKFRAIVDGNSLSGKGSLDYDGNFAFQGSLEGRNIQLKNVVLQNFQILFSADRYNGFLKGNLHFFSNSLKINNFFVKDTKGIIRFSGENRLKGNIKIKIGSIQLKKLKGNDAHYEGKINFSLKENLFKTKGDLSISSLSYNSLSPISLKSDINVTYKNRKLKITGTLIPENIPILFNYENKILTLVGKELNIRQITALYKPIDIDGTIWGKAVIDFKDKTIKADFDGKNFNIYGVHFGKGKILSQFSITDNAGRFSVNLKDKDAYCFINGEITNKKIDADITFDNVNTENFVYGKKYNFGGRLTGTGKILGFVPDFSVSLMGTAYSFHYDGIYLKNVNYNFLFKNKSKNIRLSFKADNTTGLLALNLKPFSLYLNLDFANSNISTAKQFLKKKVPAVFSYLTPQRATGTVKVSIKEKKWKIKTDIQKAKVTIDKVNDYLFVKAQGEFSNSSKTMKITFFRKGFSINRYKINEISGDIYLSDGKLTTHITGKGLENLDDMKVEINSAFELYSKDINGKVKLFLKKGSFSNHVDSTFRGNIENIKGVLKERGFMGKNPFIKTDLLYKVSISQKTVNVDIKTDLLSVILPEKSRINFHKISGSITLLPQKIEKTTGRLSVTSFTISRNYIYFFESSPLKIILKDRKVIGKPVSFRGIITGKIKKFSYDITNNTAQLYSEGFFDRNLLSIIFKYINTSGELRYKLSFDGHLKDLKRGLTFSLSSDNLNLKTPYTVGVIKLQKLIFELSEGVFRLNVNGKTTDSALGESFVKIKGKGSTEKFYGNFTGHTQFFPVKVKNIFQGNLNSDLKLKTFSKNNRFHGELKGKILLSGKLRLEKKLDSIVEGQKETVPTGNLESLELLSFNVSIESYIPLYLYGKWGKAYAEFDLNVRGTGKNPQINGNINIIYGEIFFMKNRYNIDFANIKIINNEPYISARVSTSVADTFIFIDISGSAYNPKINFFSNPPKPKNEILSILLLKDTPSALENMPVFKTVGKLLYAILPFKPTEETGLFNTGFEINILPQYSPSTGISASIYGKRNITRRIFIALSKPLGQVEEEKIGGWYGIGIKLKERTSFQYKFFETGNQEFGIVFNLPFDF